MCAILFHTIRTKSRGNQFNAIVYITKSEIILYLMMHLCTVLNFRVADKYNCGNIRQRQIQYVSHYLKWATNGKINMPGVRKQ